MGWLTLTALSEISDSNLTAMTDTGLVFRRWNSEIGPYLGRGRLEKLEKKVQAVLDITPNRLSFNDYTLTLQNNGHKLITFLLAETAGRFS